MRRSSVLLPQPDGPISETNSPGRIERSMAASACTAFGRPELNVISMPASCTAGVAAEGGGAGAGGGLGTAHDGCSAGRLRMA